MDRQSNAPNSEDVQSHSQNLRAATETLEPETASVNSAHIEEQEVHAKNVLWVPQVKMKAMMGSKRYQWLNEEGHLMASRGLRMLSIMNLG